MTPRLNTSVTKALVFLVIVTVLVVQSVITEAKYCKHIPPGRTVLRPN